jgi:hypothetical protein
MEEKSSLHHGGVAENGPTGTVTDAILAAVRNPFPDPRFSHVPGTVYGFVARIDGKKVGVVAATKSQRFAGSTHHVLNKADLESVVAGQEAGRLDWAFVVTAEVNQAGKMAVIDVILAQHLAANLKNVPPLTGRLGEFWLLHHNFLTDGEGF